MALDITLDAGRLAIVPTGTEPTDADWVAAEWVRDAPSTPMRQPVSRLSTVYWHAQVDAQVAGEMDTAWLRVLVGPAGGAALPDNVAAVDVWSKVTDSSEAPVQLHGTVPVA